MRILVIFFVGAITVTLFATANIKENYDKNTLLDHDGLFDKHYYKKSNPSLKYPYSNCGASPQLINLLRQKTTTIKPLELYTDEITRASIFLWSGIVTVVCGALSPIPLKAVGLQSVSLFTLPIGVMTGYISILISTGLIYSAKKHLNKAVWLYNREILFNESSENNHDEISTRVSFFQWAF